MRNPGEEACLLPAEVELGPGEDWCVYWKREFEGRGVLSSGHARRGFQKGGEFGQPQIPVGRKNLREERGGSEMMMGRVPKSQTPVVPYPPLELELTSISPVASQSLSTAGKPSWTTREQPSYPGMTWINIAKSALRL